MKVIRESSIGSAKGNVTTGYIETKLSESEYSEEYIVQKLVQEGLCDGLVAKEVAQIVTKKLEVLELRTVTTSFVRALVNMVLAQKGKGKLLKSNSGITIPFSDVQELIECSDKENGNVTHNPESINLALAESVIKEYALRTVFDEETAKAHLMGEIHIHDLGMVNRFYCSGHSPEYVKKYGLKNIPAIATRSNPAKTATVLARHICSMTQFLQGQFAGAIGWEAINMYFAPLLLNVSYKEIKQIAQTLIFDLSQLAGARGGQVAFTDFNVYPNVPNHYKDVYAMGSGGKFMVQDYLNDIYYFETREEAKEFADKNKYKVLKYKDFEKESRLFARAMLEVVEQGDADGMPFPFPKINFHVNKESFESEESRALLMVACIAASKNGCPYFIFDRNACSISQCCRLKIDFSEDDMKLIETPEELRFVGGQNVSINLPNIVLKVGTNEDDFYKELEHMMDISCRAHVARKEYVWKVANSENSSLSFYTSGMDQKPYVKVDKISWLIGIVGLNECVYNLTGKQLHESDEMLLKGIEIVTFMYKKTAEMGKKYNLSIKLEETPAESTANRFAKLDIKNYKEKAYHKENEFGVYYTNSIHYATDSGVDYITRLIKQSKFHSIVEAGSMIHIWGGEFMPDPKAIYELLEQTWNKTKCVQWVLSPEYTICKECNTKSNGLHDRCPKCDSDNVRGITRITGYYVYIDKFNNGKRAELKDRKREEII